ncbi:3-oxoacyl-[acyl-carrier-protein] reductase FabG [Roseovarius albus]|uniref:3-oxoacyl-[acyl-carrier-protein] reductase FabG n=1 Tax=Roseovarius albus TaxID=1247867 RepID=A0A1X6ZW28_9RHOB|nr:SDR family NAD(P)-dependent oxidoreductase [Roseovarius albus]SLN61394.1 3-oxoacyl-[acyl-carrier-protein] reductase FabG [Roseovarius albus]
MSIEIDLSGKRALITGGASGIGLACAEGLSRAGAEVTICDLSDGACRKAVQDLQSLGHTADFIVFDVSDRAACETAFEKLAADGGVDILVTCAAIVKAMPILDFDPEDWARILDVNLSGTFHCCQLAGRQMVTKGWGRIVTLSSVNGQIANAGRGAYSCTKGGVDMLTRLLAAELGEQGVTTNAVAPIPVDTPMIKKVLGPKDRQLWHDQTPIKRYATTQEVADAVCFLASEQAAFINGHILNVDGGFMSSGILPKT